MEENTPVIINMANDMVLGDLIDLGIFIRAAGKKISKTVTVH
jgi:hypothetical protein